MYAIAGNTYKVGVWVANWIVLQPQVEKDDERMNQVAGKTDFGQRGPKTPRQEPVDKTCNNKRWSAEILVVVSSCNDYF